MVEYFGNCGVLGLLDEGSPIKGSDNKLIGEAEGMHRELDPGVVGASFGGSPVAKLPAVIRLDAIFLLSSIKINIIN